MQAHPRTYFIILLALIYALLLAGCGPVGLVFNAEEAALKSAYDEAASGIVMGKGAQADRKSLRVLQSTQMDDQTFVLVFIEGKRPDLGMARSTCTFLYAMVKQRMGNYVPTSGGGACESTIGPADPNAPSQQPISIQGSVSSGDSPADIGTSTLAGQVFQDDIKTIRVTWADNTIQEAQVLNQSYIIARAGQVNFLKVEAIDRQGSVVYTNRPEVAPGKR